MSDTAPKDPETPRMDLLLSAGLGGLSVAVLIQLIDKQPRLDNLLGVALCSFAVALPILVASFLLDTARPGVSKPIWRVLFDLGGVILALGGFTVLLFHLHLLAGGLFVVAAFACIVVVMRVLHS